MRNADCLQLAIPTFGDSLRPIPLAAALAAATTGLPAGDILQLRVR